MRIMKKMLSFAVMAMMAVGFTACSESDADDPGKGTIKDLSGTYWVYDEPVFEFEYPGDVITISMGAMGEDMEMTTDEITTMFTMFANEKMSAYMRHFYFVDRENLNVGYVKDGENGDITLQYQQQDKMLAVDMSVINEKMPTISANYNIINENGENHMEIFFEKLYLTIMMQQMLPTFLPSIMGNIIPDFDKMPEVAQQAIIASFSTQINDILSKTEKLTVGLCVKQQPTEVPAN